MCARSDGSRETASTISVIGAITARNAVSTKISSSWPYVYSVISRPISSTMSTSSEDFNNTAQASFSHWWHSAQYILKI